MKKTAGQLVVEVLKKYASHLKLANPKVWRRMVDATAKAQGFTPPTDKEFKVMFPDGWVPSSTDNLETRIHNSEWFQDSRNRQAYRPSPRQTSAPEGPSPQDLNLGRIFKNLARQNRVLAGVKGVGGAAFLGNALYQTTDAQTPLERNMILTPTGIAAGTVTSSIINDLRQAKILDQLADASSSHFGTILDLDTKLKRLERTRGKRDLVGGLVGAALGLGAATAWNARAKNLQEKAAEITPEEVTAGLAGTPLGLRHSRQEQQEFIDKVVADRAGERNRVMRNYLLGGTALGAGTAALAKQMLGDPIPLRKVIPGGAALGLAAGGVLGLQTRSMLKDYHQELGELLARVTRTGRVPRDTFSEEVIALAPYATGVRPDASPLPQREVEGIHRDIAKTQLKGTAVGVPAALGIIGVVNRLARRGSPVPAALQVANLGTLGAAIAAASAMGGTQAAKTKVDLKQRGYENLAKHIS